MRQGRGNQVWSPTVLRSCWMAQGLSTATASPTLKSKSHCQYHSKSREALHLNANNLYNIKSTLFYLVIVFIMCSLNYVFFFPFYLKYKYKKNFYTDVLQGFRSFYTLVYQGFLLPKVGAIHSTGVVCFILRAQLVLTFKSANLNGSVLILERTPNGFY